MQGTTIISITSLEAPKDARKRKWDEARMQLEKAVTIHSNYAAAWFELGQVREREPQPEQARKAHSRALAADPRYVYVYPPSPASSGF